MLAILRRHKIFDVDPHLAALADDEVELLADRMIAHRPLADEHFVAADRFEHRRLPARQRNAQPLGLLVLHQNPGDRTSGVEGKTASSRIEARRRLLNTKK